MKRFIESYQLEHFCTKLLLYSLDQATEGSDFVVADENTAKLLPNKINSKTNLILRSGEEHKTLSQIEALIDAFIEHRLSRSSRVLAFGGGLLCDLVGFATASYMRGCQLILVPTTLLAMVDAGLGGKTGCNYQNYKNMIGAFYPASELRIVPETLSMLPARQFQSGLAELCKHSLLSDTDELWNTLQNHKASLRKLAQPDREITGQTAQNFSEISELLIEGVRVKGKIVERDLYEHGERAFLNLGHTYAHALERSSGFAVTHGEAVAWGIYQALQFSTRHDYCSTDYTQEVSQLLCDMGFVLELHKLCPNLLSPDLLKPRSNLQAEQTGQIPNHEPQIVAQEVVAKELVRNMQLDKKRSQSGIRLILQKGRGKTFIAEFPENVIFDAILDTMQNEILQKTVSSAVSSL